MNTEKHLETLDRIAETGLRCTRLAMAATIATALVHITLKHLGAY